MLVMLVMLRHRVSLLFLLRSPSLVPAVSLARRTMMAQALGGSDGESGVAPGEPNLLAPAPMDLVQRERWWRALSRRCGSLDEAWQLRDACGALVLSIGAAELPLRLSDAVILASKFTRHHELDAKLQGVRMLHHLAEQCALPEHAAILAAQGDVIRVRRLVVPAALARSLAHSLAHCITLWRRRCTPTSGA